MIWRFPALVAIVVAAGVPAGADDNPFTNVEPPGRIGVQPAPIPGVKPDPLTRIVITRETCANLARHSPAPDVTYQPGVDAHGRPVAPADLSGGFRYDLPPQIAFDVAINPLRGGAETRFGETRMTVGRVEYDLASGRATFEGQPLTDDETLMLSQRCQRIVQGRGG